jgi:hypothetical protein
MATMEIVLTSGRWIFKTSVERPTFRCVALEPREIRILVLLPGYRSDPVKCQPIKQSLDSLSSPYEALSYEWGPEEPIRSIYLDGVRINIRHNLKALRSIRYTKTRRTIWVDAICINQDDIIERNTQVAMMSEIYRRASQVLVSLGGVRLDGVGPRNTDFVLDSYKGSYCHFPPKGYFDLSSLSYQAMHDGMARIFQRRYWKRLWII